MVDGRSGRQPWIVYKLMTTAQGMSPTLSTTQVAMSLVTFLVLYTILGALFAYLFAGKIQHGPESLEDIDGAAISSLPDTLREVFSRRPEAG